MDTNLHLTASLIKSPDLSITANCSFQFIYYPLPLQTYDEPSGNEIITPSLARVNFLKGRDHDYFACESQYRRKTAHSSVVLFHTSTFLDIYGRHNI